MIKVGAVSYLNTKPLIYGFEQGLMQDEVKLVIDYPANIASLLRNDEIDIGLIPVAAIAELATPEIISDFCIGSDGEVASVCLFSDVPLNEIETVVLDYQSRTSVELLKILLAEHWQITPALLNGHKDYEKEIAGTTAGLVIGDRALEQRFKSKYIYDLGFAWKAMTGLPFVYAAWVSNKKMSDGFLTNFNKANALGLVSIDTIVEQQQNKLYDLNLYFTQNISYRFDEHKKEGMQLFLNKITANQKMLAVAS